MEVIDTYNEGTCVVSIEYDRASDKFVVYKKEDDQISMIRTFSLVGHGVGSGYEYAIIRRANGLYHVLIRKTGSGTDLVHFLSYYAYYTDPVRMMPAAEFYGWDKFMIKSIPFWQCTFIKTTPTDKLHEAVNLFMTHLQS